MKNRYAKGVRNEWKSIRLLQSTGWTCFRTAGSHSNWDIIALKPGRPPLLVQVKSNRFPSGISIDPVVYDRRWWYMVHVWQDYKGCQMWIYGASNGWIRIDNAAIWESLSNDVTVWINTMVTNSDATFPAAPDGTLSNSCPPLPLGSVAGKPRHGGSGRTS